MNNIKNNLKRMGFSLVDVGTKLGVSKSSMTQIVNGNPTLNTLQRICEICNCSLDELTKENEGVTPSTQSASFLCPHCGKEIKLSVKQ